MNRSDLNGVSLTFGICGCICAGIAWWLVWWLAFVGAGLAIIGFAFAANNERRSGRNVCTVASVVNAIMLIVYFICVSAM